MVCDISSVLFACTFNSVRSPMAEGLMRHFHGKRIYVESAGVREGEIDPFVVAVMDEIGIDLSHFVSRTFDQLEDSSFDLIISLSPQAHHRAVEIVRTMACEVEYWKTMDPTAVDGSREVILDAYRQVRDGLSARILDRFPLPGQGIGMGMG
ncbi:protein-tyrosine-phosphatase [uncultured Gammaproteobacteria bacterium]